MSRTIIPTRLHAELISDQAMTAARQFLPPTHCSLLVDKGYDFPPEFALELHSLGEEMIWFRERKGKTTRAVNIYSGHKIG
jgi:hypothetical protein